MSPPAMKRCPKCGVTKRKTKKNFVHAKSPVTGKTLWKHCRICDHALQQRNRAALKDDPERQARRREAHRQQQARARSKNPEKYRQYVRDYRERLKEDPERYAEIELIPARIRRSENRDMSHVTRPTVEPYKTPSRFADEVVNVEPLRKYLMQVFPGWRPGEISNYLAVQPRVVFNVMTPDSGVDQILLTSADRILTDGLSRPDLLNALYPPETA